MRVIAGTARRLQLKTLDGMDTRPTTDRIKETLFNMISAELYDSNFLDLFSGSGGIGIEALSRGGKCGIRREESKSYEVHTGESGIYKIKRPGKDDADGRICGAFETEW